MGTPRGLVDQKLVDILFNRMRKDLKGKKGAKGKTKGETGEGTPIKRIRPELCTWGLRKEDNAAKDARKRRWRRRGNSISPPKRAKRTPKFKNEKLSSRSRPRERAATCSETLGEGGSGRDRKPVGHSWHAL